MTYTFGIAWRLRTWGVLTFEVVWDFGDGTAPACGYPECYCTTCKPPVFCA